MANPTVRVRLFAMLREIAGTPALELELEGSDSVESCWLQLCRRFQGLESSRGSIRAARNLQYVDWDAPVSGGDELAFLPPVSGGATPAELLVEVRVGSEPIDLEAMTAAVQRRGIGAIATFVGLVRDPDQGRAVPALKYEAYPEMAEPVLAEICREALPRFDATEARVQHRTGRVAGGVASVVVVVGAAHRHQALDCCAYIIDELKSRAPIWKSEG
ncbi:MAG TPA: molybdenum cofactor biosynthesis protein MoaE [Candidatus Dormibacteraeota bacterium]|nr:molybdenum cofactor biosynthesis protein MoaE [Candidatus Dormibacteraeota bacterium]